MSPAAGAFTVRPYEPELRPIWDELVDRSRSRHFFFRRAYLEYHADRFADASQVVFRGRAPAAALPASRHGAEIVSHGGLTFGGVLTGERGGAVTFLRLFDALLEGLRAQGAERLVYKAVPHIYHLVPGEEDLYALFRHGARLVRRDISSSLRLDHRLRYAKSRRWSLRRAREAGIVSELSTDFAAFMTIEEQTLARHGVRPVHSADELALLAARFPRNIRLHVARRNGELLAGMVVYATPAVAHAQYIGATAAGRELGAVDVVVDDAIAAYGDDHRWFDFGISTTEGGRVLNEGLIANKESYGARAVVYDQYALEL